MRDQNDSLIGMQSVYGWLVASGACSGEMRGRT